MGLFAKKDTIDAIPNFLPPTKKGEKSRYEGVCVGIKGETIETPRLRVEYTYTFEPVRTFPDGACIFERYGLPSPMDRPTGNVVMNTEEHEAIIIAVNKLIGWNGKEDAASFRAPNPVILSLTVMPPKRKEGQKGVWPGKIIIEDVDPMPSPIDLAKLRLAADAMRQRLAALSADPEGENAKKSEGTEADAEAGAEVDESEGEESEASATPTEKPAKAKPAKSPAKSAR